MRRFFDYNFNRLELGFDADFFGPVITRSLVAFTLPELFAAPPADVPLFANIDGTSGDDTLDGTADADTINGFAGNDIMNGLAGDDILNGGAGDDFINGGEGADTIDGGIGFDTLSFESETGAVNVFYSSSSDVTSVTTTTGTDSFTNIERIIGGSGDDRFYTLDANSTEVFHFEGGGGDDFFRGSAGDDIFIGGEGDDFVIARRGNDTFDGGSGSDRYSTFSLGLSFNPTQAYSADLALGQILNNGFGDVVTLINVEGLSGGTFFADSFLGDENDNDIFGNLGGADLVDGRGGDDYLALVSGAGTVIGGTGIDTFYFSGSQFLQGTFDQLEVFQGVEIDLVMGTLLDGFNEGGGSISGVENIQGSFYSDVLIGDGNDNVIQVLEGQDFADGGAGIDTISYDLRFGSSEAVSVNLATGTAIQGVIKISLSTPAALDIAYFTDALNGDLILSIASTDFIGDEVAGVVRDVESDVTDASGTRTVTFAPFGLDGYQDNRSNDISLSSAVAEVRLVMIVDPLGSLTYTVDASVIGIEIVDLLELVLFSPNAPSPLVGVVIDSGGTIAMGTETSTLLNFENIIGSSFDDTLSGDAGDNEITGAGGDDVIDGGMGVDVAIYSGAQADYTVTDNMDGTFTVTDNVGTDGTDTLSTIEFLRFADGDVELSSGPVFTEGDDVVDGTEGDDVLDALGGNDTVNGLGGNDIIFGRAGNDTLDGGDGDDTLHGGEGSDTLYGGNGDDVISWGGGENFVYGGSGLDTFVILERGSFRVGLVDFEDGVDVIDLSTIGVSSFDQIVPHLSQAGSDGLVFLETRWASGIETLFTDTVNLADLSAADFVFDTTTNGVTITGDAHRATLFGSSGDDVVNGGSGDEDIHGGNGDDLISGGDGTNTLRGGQGNDTFVAGAGIDIFIGGDGIDTVDYSGATFAINVNLLTGVGAGSIAAGDTLFEIETLIGSDFNDTLTGSVANNIIIGGVGSDILAGGMGADTLDGGAGFDTADYRDASSAVRFNVDTGGTLGDALGDTFVSIERYFLSDFNDIITGSSANEFFFGEDGNDQINGGGGIDRIYGGDGNDIQRGQDGNDTLYGSAGSDQLNGGAGFDIANYSLAAAGVIVNMLTGGTGGDAAGDTYFGIEAVYGSDFDDGIFGNNSANELRGGDGNDNLEGGGGNDRLFGGAGEDMLFGGTGTDIAVYTDASAGVGVNLESAGTFGDALNDIYSEIEWVFGSDFDDDITGDSANNRLEGRDGNDILNGGEGNDRLLGGDGNDTINGGDGVDTIFGQNGDDIMTGGAGNDFFFGGAGADSHDGGAGIDTVSYLASSSGVTVNMQGFGTASTGDATGDSFTSIERIFGSGLDDNLLGNSDNNTLLGNGGDDYLAGGGGNDSLNGGAGVDSFGYDEVVDGADVITGFTLNETVFIFGGTVTDFASLQVLGSDAGANVIFDFGGGNTLTIVGHNLADLDASNFDFSGMPPASEPLSDPDAFSADVVELFDMDALI